MKRVSYDKSSIKSIYEHASKLTGYSLSEKVDLPPDIANIRNRGDLGTLIEKFYFEHIPPNKMEPDFPEAGLELKTTGLIEKSNGTLQAKERLVLTMINYHSLATEEFHSSHFLKKCGKTLVLFYRYEKGTPVIDRKFIKTPIILDFEWDSEYVSGKGELLSFRIPKKDLEVIERDWLTIQRRVLEGKAHELSEGDTFYLAACRKGSGGIDESLQSQPFSGQKAKSRAFSLKPSYMNKLLQGSVFESNLLEANAVSDLEEALKLRFESYLGMSTSWISSTLNLHKLSINHKSFHRDLTNRMLSVDGKKPVEFDKAGVEIKTIRLNEKGKPKESMSFPAFDFREIIEQEWEESSFFERIEKKFLLVIFRLDKRGVERLDTVAFWNMPYGDRLEARKVWEETKIRLKGNRIDLPRSSENLVAHVRPKGRDGSDKAMTPSGAMKLKQCFWLNRSYIENVVKNLGSKV